MLKRLELFAVVEEKMLEVKNRTFKVDKNGIKKYITKCANIMVTSY